MLSVLKITRQLPLLSPRFLAGIRMDMNLTITRELSMVHMSRGLRLSLCAVTLVTLMSACSGSSDSTASTPPPSSGSPPDDTTPPDVIEGIATPSSVAVVTATNAT